MHKSEQTNRVKAVRDYLAAIGMPVSTTQACEIVARSLGHKNKHTLATSLKSPASSTTRSGLPETVDLDGKPLRVFKLTDEPFSLDEMRAMDWTFDVVVPVALDALEDIERMNDSVSQRITGSEFALEGIGFAHLPELNYGAGWVAYRVTASVSEPALYFDEEEALGTKQFYAGLLELASRLKGNQDVTFIEDGVSVSLVLWRMHADAIDLLRRYAREEGAEHLNDAINRRGDAWVFEARRAGSSTAEPVTAVALKHLKYATRMSDRSFHFDRDGKSVELIFND